MTYLEELHTATKQRRERMSHRAPDALPQRVKPKPLIIPLVNGRQIFPDPLSPPPPSVRLREIIQIVTTPIVMPNRITVLQVVSAVARHYKLRVSDLTGHSRQWSIVYPRHVAMFLAYELTGRSLPDVGRRMGGFDHSTLVHACRRVKQRMADDPELAAKVATIRCELKNVL